VKIEKSEMKSNYAIRKFILLWLANFTLLINPVITHAQTSENFQYRIVEQGGEQPRRSYQDLFVQVDGREYLVTNEHLQVYPFKSIFKVIDLDQDGRDEAILEIAHGGNCCGPEFVVVSPRDKYFYSISQHSSLDGAFFPKLSVLEKENRLLLQSRTISATLDMGEVITLLEFIHGELLEVSRVVNAALLSALVEINSSDFQLPELEPITSIIHLDSDNENDALTCRFWDRWGEIICEIQSTEFGIVELSSSCDRVGVLETSSNGLRDMVCGRSRVMSFDGTRYE